MAGVDGCGVELRLEVSGDVGMWLPPVTCVGFSCDDDVEL